MGAPGPRRVLLCSGNERLSETAARTLTSSGNEVVALSSPARARDWLRANRANLVVVHLDFAAADFAEAARLLEEVRSCGQGERCESLVLLRIRGDAELVTFFRELCSSNFLGLGEDDVLDPVELGVTSSKILSGDIFGVRRYLGPDARVEEIAVRSSRQKGTIVGRAQDFALEAGCTPRVAQQVAVAMDELLTNAVYNAPVDGQGKPRYARRSRSVPVDLEPSEEVKATLASDGRRVCVSALDPFGSLPPERAREYLAKCFARGEDQVDQKEGGAGLGIYYLFNLVRGFVLNLAPGKATESIGLFEITRSFREHASKPRSFNLFVAPPER